MLRQTDGAPLPRLKRRRPGVLLLSALMLLGALAGCSSGSSSVQTSITSAAPTNTPITSPSPAFALPSQPSATTQTVRPTSPPSPTGGSKRSTGPSASTTTNAPTTPPSERFFWTIGPTTAKTPATLAAIEAAAPVFQGYMATYDDSLRSPMSRDWQPVMSGFASGQALTAWRQTWQEFVTYGVHRLGTASSAGRVDGASSTFVSVRACMDISHTGEVDKDGNAVPLESGLPSKSFAWLLTFKLVAGHMRVNNIVSRTAAGKAISC